MPSACRWLALLLTVWPAYCLHWAGAASLRDERDLAKWAFQPGSDAATPPKPSEWATVDVPFLWTAAWKYKVGRAGKSWEKLKLRELDSGWFETTTAIPAAWQGKRIYLELSGIQCDAIVWANGRRQGELRGPDGRVEIADSVTPGQEARVRLWVTRWWRGVKNQRADDPLRSTAIKGQAQSTWYQTEADVRRGTPGGLAGRAMLRAVSERGEIENVFVETSVRRQELRVHVSCVLRDRIATPRLRVEVKDLDGGTTGPPSASLPIQAGAGRQHVVVIPWERPRLWEVGDPHLYRLRVELAGNGGPVDEYPGVRFGFREVWTEGKELVLNGHPLKLRLPYFVSSVPQMIFFEGMGFNAMEFQPNPTAWYGTWGLFPQERATQAGGNLLDAADERGWAVLMPAPGV